MVRGRRAAARRALGRVIAASRDGEQPGSSAPLGLGLASLGRPAYLNLGHGSDVATVQAVSTLESRAHDVLDAAWASGIRHVDAARSYGLAERFLGSWLAAHPGRRSAVTLGSKWGYTYVGDWQVDVETHEVKDHGLETFERQWPETLAALGTPPDLYLIHSVTPDSPALSDRTLLRRLAELSATGVRVGLSTSGPDQASVLRHAMALDGTPFSAVQATWNLLEPSVGDALAEAAERGWQVALKETVANGRLTARGDAPPLLAEVAALHDASVDAVALAAARTMPVSVVLVGASTVEQLQSNVRSDDVELSADEVVALAGLAEAPAAYWRQRSGLPWT